MPQESMTEFQKEAKKMKMDSWLFRENPSSWFIFYEGYEEGVVMLYRKGYFGKSDAYHRWDL